jgi:hypothetical protein
VSIGAEPERPVAAEESVVQHTPERWIVHARAPGCHGEPFADALRAIVGRRAERCLDAPVRAAGRRDGSSR